MKQFKSFFFKTLLASLVFTQFTTACVMVKKEPEVEKKEFVNLESFHIVGYSLRTSYEDEKHANDIEKLWNHLEENFDAQLFHSRANDKIYVVTYNFTEINGTESFDVLLGYKVDNPSSSLKSKFISVKIPSSRYYKQLVKGTSEGSVVKAWEQIFKTDINRSYKYDFEAYSFNKDFEMENVEIFVSVFVKDQ